MAPTDLETLRLGEGMLGILLAGGIEPQAAAWAIDALFLYVAASCLELSMVEQRKVSNDAEWVVDPAELRRRLTGLPVNVPTHGALRPGDDGRANRRPVRVHPRPDDPRPHSRGTIISLCIRPFTIRPDNGLGTLRRGGSFPPGAAVTKSNGAQWPSGPRCTT